MIRSLSTWLASRPRTERITTVALHSTDGASAGSSINWLRQIGLSYHYVIERDGTITKCVPVSRQALHAGRSVGPGGANVNRYSIGVAFANHESRREAITKAQRDACARLLRELVAAESKIDYLTTHYAISPGRKSDPAMLSRFQLVELSRGAGLRLWLKPGDEL